MFSQKKFGLPESLIKSVAEAMKSHTVPKTEKEKKLAALAEPKDKITHKDVMVGRGVIAKENTELDEADQYSIENPKTGQTYHVSRYPITKDNTKYKKIKAAGGNHVHATIYKNGKPVTEETELDESHFKVGDDVVCKASGMEGEVVKVDKEQKGKYYTVKREDGKTVKYAPDELKAEKEEEDEEEKEMKEAKDAGASKKKEEKFHMNLDKLVHKTFGHSPAEKKEKMKEEAEQIDEISLKKAIGAHAERMARAASAENRFDREDHYDKAKQSRSYIGKKYGNEGLGKSFDATVKRLRKEEVELEERVKTTHEDPLVTVHDKDGLHTHANLSTANRIFNTNVKHTAVHKGPVTVTSGREDKNKLKFALSKHHAKAVEDDMKEEVEQIDESMQVVKKVMSKAGNHIGTVYKYDKPNALGYTYGASYHPHGGKGGASGVDWSHHNSVEKAEKTIHSQHGLYKAAATKALQKAQKHKNSIREETDTPGNSYTHQCAVHVKHSKLGEGKTLFSQHAEPAEDGTIAWYDVMFEHGIEKKVPTSELEILVSESHMNHKKKK